jgi:hypothetical protein
MMAVCGFQFSAVFSPRVYFFLIMNTVLCATLFTEIGEADENVNQAPLVLIVVSSTPKDNMLARSPTLELAGTILLGAQALVKQRHKIMGFVILPNGISDLFDLMHTPMSPPNNFTNFMMLEVLDRSYEAFTSALRSDNQPSRGHQLLKLNILSQ